MNMNINVTHTLFFPCRAKAPFLRIFTKLKLWSLLELEIH